ncbi:MAG: alanine racemase [Clostridia bacterium]|nr:alanine racemase [Clostridia bacterium]
MNNYTKRSWAEVDLDALKNNIRNIKTYVGEKTKVLVIVKADAYGHGAVQSAKALIANGADCLGVAFIDEAEELRCAGIDAPILILGYTCRQDVKRVVEAGVMPTIFSYDLAKEFSNEAVKSGKTVKIHVKIDSGMNRVGFECNDASVEEIIKIKNLPGIEIEGVFTHLSCADGKNREYTDIQVGKFKQILEKLEKKGVKIPVKHACNSAGIVQYPEYHFDMVRSGIITYGLPPSDEVDVSPLKLKPAMTFKSIVARVFDIAAGEKVSYGGTFCPDKDMKAAVVTTGYADGYSRLLSNKAMVTVNGQPAKVVGRICMDQCIIDVTNVNNIKVEDEVIIAGGQPGCHTSFDFLAGLCGTISYELICLVGKRVPRIYLGE